jgi:hypothetical protein
MRLLLFIPLIGLTIGFATLAWAIIQNAVKEKDLTSIAFAIAWPSLGTLPIGLGWCFVLGLNGIGPFSNF